METQNETVKIIEWINNHLSKTTLENLKVLYEDKIKDYGQILSGSKLIEEVNAVYVDIAIQELNDTDFLEVHKVFFPFVPLHKTHIKTVEEIYDLITNSAKLRFDYASFEKSFTDYSKELKHLPETITWIIINRLAKDVGKEIICAEIQARLIPSGFQIKELEKFVEDNDKVFKIEIYLNRLADAMLKTKSPNEVYRKVVEAMRNKQKPMYGTFPK